MFEVHPPIDTQKANVMTSSIKCHLPSKVIFHQRLSSINGHPPPKVVLHQMSSSIKGCLPSKIVFHQRLSSVKERLLLKVVFHTVVHSCRSESSIYMLVCLDKVLVLIFVTKPTHQPTDQQSQTPGLGCAKTIIMEQKAGAEQCQAQTSLS